MDSHRSCFPVLHHLQELAFMSIGSDMPSNYLILCHPLLLQPSIFPTIRVFSNESALHISWTMCWSFSSSINPFSEYSRLISLVIDWFDFLTVQGTLKRLFQHHSLKASFLWCSDFFMVQLLHSYMTTGKTIGLTIWTFVAKEMSLLFNTLSRFVIVLFSRSKRLQISRWQSPSAVILEPKKKKVTVSIVSLSICHEMMGLDAMIFSFWMLNFKPAFSLSSFIKRLFSSSLLSTIRVASSACLKLLIFLPAILIPVCTPSSQAFHLCI